MILKRVSKYIIDEKHSLYEFCDEQTFKAKNMKNLANYHIRQCFILSGKETLNEEQKSYLQDINKAIDKFNEIKKERFYKSKPGKVEKKLIEITAFESSSTKKKTKKFNKELEKLQKSLESLKNSEYKPQKQIGSENGLFSYDFLNFYFAEWLRTDDNPYRLMAVQAAQQTLRNLFKDWKSFFASIKDYKKNKSKYSGRPKLPKYKKKDGRCKISFTNQNCKVKDDKYVSFPMSSLALKIGVDTSNLKLKEVRIIPMGSVYKIEIVWDKTFNSKVDLDETRYCAIDLGLSNLASIVNNIGLKPIIINGKPLKSINQYYNKLLAKYKSEMPFRTISRYNKAKGECSMVKEQFYYSKKIEKLTLKRNLKIEDYMHKASSYIINYCIEHKIGNIIIGNNKNWKSNITLGVTNNQNFVQVPFSRLIDMISYKAEPVGLKVEVIEESFTSQASFLDLDKIPSYEDKAYRSEHKFSGKRISRGLYKTKNLIINADVNGSYNILRKFKDDLFSKEAVKTIKYIPTRVNIGGYCLKKKLAQT